MQMFRLRLQLRCAICSGDNSARKDTCVGATRPRRNANDTLANVDRSLRFYGNSTHQKKTAQLWLPQAPLELKISQAGCRGGVCHHSSSAAENSCSSSRRQTFASCTFSAVVKIKKYIYILMEELLTASTHPLISASSKYHPHLPRRHAQEDVQASQPPVCSERLVPECCYCLPTWRLHGNVRWLLDQYLHADSGDQGPNKSITDNYMYLSHPSALQSAARLWRRDIDLVHYISLVVQPRN